MDQADGLAALIKLLSSSGQATRDSNAGPRDPRAKSRDQKHVKITKFAISGPLLISPTQHGDSRGFFSETFRQNTFEDAAGPTVFVQDNHSYSTERGVIRGLHYQAPPHGQGKLVRVTRGAVFDVFVDIRVGSPTYGQHLGVELSAENWLQLWVPAGFLHGFCTLTEEVEFLYKVTSYYNAEADGAVAFDDPDLGVAWPLDGAEPLISDKDRRGVRFRDFKSPFVYQA
jgi:dTDP-4-dehydrorhamnose 3,5-epimerase